MSTYKTGWIMLCAFAAAYVSAEQSPTHNPFRKPDFEQSGALSVTANVEAVSTTLPIVGATLAGGEHPLAIINGKVLGIGEIVNGFRLVSIQEGLTIFERDGQQHEVKVKSADSEREEKERANAQE